MWKVCHKLHNSIKVARRTIDALCFNLKYFILMLLCVASVILYFHECTIEEKALLYMQKWYNDGV